MRRDYYAVLGVARAESARGIQPFQPFRDVVEAFEGLVDPRRRIGYDVETQPAQPAISLLRDFDVEGPSIEEVFDRFVQSFTQRHALKSHTVAPIELELEVSPEQAARGGTLAIAVPVFYACATCGGTGRDWLYLCSGCGGRGIVADEERVRVAVPSHLGDGDVVEVSLASLGIPDQVLRMGFRVGGPRT